jgi:hypothetical protein
MLQKMPMRELWDWYKLYSHKLTHTIRLEAACAACGQSKLLLLARTLGLLWVNGSSQVGQQKASATQSIYHLLTPSKVLKRFWLKIIDPDSLLQPVVTPFLSANWLTHHATGLLPLHARTLTNAVVCYLGFKFQI